MSIMQYYYTSFVHPQTNSAGFQILAMSPGISPDTQMLITRLISYSIPQTMDERDCPSHPVALRYFYRDPMECILLCSQSNGNDESGRPGNFFAHVLILEPEMFKTIPPIFYWQSPFWLKYNTEMVPQSNVLPILSAFEVMPSLDVERVWSFLASMAHDDHFYRLMSAVVHCHKTLRRVVIVDTADHVALWVAAVSCLLPPDYRPLLSFATYHHDPRQGHFMITGTTSDSSFSNVAESYFSYFVVNNETNSISDVDLSVYAKLVGNITSSDQYESQVLPFFALVIRRFPHLIRQVGQVELTTSFEQLDMFALYYMLVDQQPERGLSDDEMQAVDFALTGFEQLRMYNDDDISDLQALKNVLDRARPSETSNSKFEQIYNRLEKLFTAPGGLFA